MRRLRNGKNILLEATLLSLVLVALGTVLSCQMYGQVSGGTISGVASDPSGAVIANAQISIKNVSTGVVRVATSDAAGFYMAPNLLPGTYEVTASAAGFSTEVRSGVQLTVGAQQVLNLKLAVGQVSQKIEVTGEAPDIQLASSSISDIVDSTTVRELPLNGRDWTSLATLQPGVVSLASLQANVSTGFQRGERGFSSTMTISGAKGPQIAYRINGINVNDYVGGSPGSVFGAALGVDAIQEFSVLTSNYSTEYGRASGGVVNAITRSGSNQFHGTGFEFIRNSALDARNFFDGPTIPPFKRNQFGGSIGGPIRKDRTFFFADYEGLRQSLGTTNVNIVPSADARNGIIHNADGTTTTITVDPQVQPFLGLWPLPNGSILAPGNTGIYTVATNQNTVENFATARIDHTFSQKDSLFGSWQIDRATLGLPDSLNDLLSGSTTKRQFFSLEETHSFKSSVINSVRIGFNRNEADNAYPLSAVNPLTAAGSLNASGIPGVGPPVINVGSGVTEFTGGFGSTTTNDFLLNAYQAYDDLFVTKGIHSLKFGFAAERDQMRFLQLTSQGGTFSFNSLTDFLTDAPHSINANAPGSIFPRYWRQSIFGGYAQDDIRLRPNLTINLGLRYEMSTVPTEKYGKVTILRDVTSPTLTLGNPMFNNPTLRNFEPRVGFAWDPFRDGKTSVRGGFGIFDVLPLLYEYDSGDNWAPFSVAVTSTHLPQGSFPTGAFADAFSSAQLRGFHIDPNPERNYVMQWNLSVQREIVPSLTATIAYVGSHTLHGLTKIDDENYVQPTSTSEGGGYLWTSPVGSGTVINPLTGRMGYTSWNSDGFYDALELNITKRLSHGFQIQGSYTWSKSIDESSASVSSDTYANAITSMLFFDPHIRRAVSDYNVPQNFVINYIWNIPSPKSWNGAAAFAAGGWQLGGVWTIQSGLPFTPILGGDPLGENNNDPFDYPDRLFTGPGCKTAVNPGNVQNYINLSCFTFPTAPTAAYYTANCDPALPFPSCSNLLGTARRNSLIGPGLMDFDFSIFKNNYIRKISETFNAQFRAEMFNIFNRANFQAPLANNALFDQTTAPIGGAGELTATTTSAREIQFALKLIW